MNAAAALLTAQSRSWIVPMALVIPADTPEQAEQLAERVQRLVNRQFFAACHIDAMHTAELPEGHEFHTALDHTDLDDALWRLATRADTTAEALIEKLVTLQSEGVR